MNWFKQSQKHWKDSKWVDLWYISPEKVNRFRPSSEFFGMMGSYFSPSIKRAQYENYKSQIEESARNNPYPFQDWFGGGDRVYVPFQATQPQALDQDVIGLLTDNGCQVTDYRAGYCQQGNRTFRIGKYIEQLRRNELKDLERQSQQGEIYNLLREVDRANAYYDDIMDTFVNSSFRTQNKQNQFHIVISQNPHDIAAMSTGRDWNSCMNLEGGSNASTIYCEVATGGLVAYLIREDDPEITNPLARIHIRRFTNREGNSVAIPERSVYGNEVEGFYETVLAWLNGMQENMSPGMYRREGGAYSDTFTFEQLIGPKKPEDMVKWFRGEGDDVVYSIWIVRDNLYDDFKSDYQYMHINEDEEMSIENHTKEFKTKEEAENYLDIVSRTEQDEWEREKMGEEWAEFDDEEGEWKTQRFKLTEIKKDHTREMKSHAARYILEAEKGVYPMSIIQEIKNFAMDNMGVLLDQVIEKYPEIFSKEEIEQLGETQNIKLVKSLPEENKESHLREWQQSIERHLDISPVGMNEEFQSTINSLISSENEESHLVVKNYFLILEIDLRDNVFHPLEELFDKIPETVIRKLVDLASRLQSLNINETIRATGGRSSDMWQRIMSQIAHLFFMKDADTPVVQGFYESLLPYYGDRMNTDQNYSILNVDNLGYYIGKLGENGQQFIPFMEEKLAEAEEKLQSEQLHLIEENANPRSIERNLNYRDKEVEKYLHILDALKSGTGRSKKYKFYGHSSRFVKIACNMNWFKQANTQNWYRAYDSMDAGQLQSAIAQLEQQIPITSGQYDLLQLNKRVEYARNALSKQTGQPVQAPVVQDTGMNQSVSNISVGDEITFMMGNPPYFQPEKAKVEGLEGDGSVWVVDHSNRKLRVYPNQIQ